MANKEITVRIIGAAGSGKTHAAAVIEAALKTAYPKSKICVVLTDLEDDRACGGPHEPEVHANFKLTEEDSPSSGKK